MSEYIGRIAYGVGDYLDEIESAKIIRDSPKQVVLDKHLHYVDSNGVIRCAKIIHKKHMCHDGLPLSAGAALQQRYRLLIVDNYDARERYNRAIAAIEEKRQSLDRLCSLLGIKNPLVKYPPLSRPAKRQGASSAPLTDEDKEAMDERLRQLRDENRRSREKSDFL